MSAESEGAGQEPPDQNIQMKIANEMRGGVWANFAIVSHSQYEFTIDFARLDFSQQHGNDLPAIVVSRVNLSPLMVSQLLNALTENWQKYVQRAMPKEIYDDGPTD